MLVLFSTNTDCISTATGPALEPGPLGEMGRHGSSHQEGLMQWRTETGARRSTGTLAHAFLPQYPLCWWEQF